MPRHTINYDNVCFYKIVCQDLSVKDVYVGHTTDFATRKKCHKNTSSNPNSRGHHNRVYQFINENGGWENFDMILIEKIKCDDKLDALRKERAHIEELNATLNQIVPSRTKKEWTEDNKEHVKEYKATYHQTNIDKIHQQKKTYYDQNKDYTKEKAQEYYKQNIEKCKQWKNGKTLCGCGKEYTNANKARHERTQYHIDNIMK